MYVISVYEMLLCQLVYQHPTNKVKYIFKYEIIDKCSTTVNVPSPPLEFFFQEQSYSSLHSGWSLAWDHVRSDIDDPCGTIADFCGVIADFCGVIADFCGVIADFCGVIADFCGVIAIPAALSRSLRRSAGADEATPIVARLAKHHKTLLNIVKHHETHVKHCKTS